ncbi:uncharacterized protein TM35_000161700 [Trypanosoma theileri]|uniref:Uncharacterized protein n=1 Tax=Trypanosoma theileri TaxID=67003 RepID=A0A1X0NV26_9TRYP|nr:uncharacterized protein TM35_000161700 [Trypanosoma theileri]ORC88532.1 hypothetical protein TM35_000161700 [Trypanosoma theileri]
MSLEDRGAVVVWEGEWPSLRRRVAAIRRAAWVPAAALAGFFDVAGHIATAKIYTARADRFVTEQTAIASEQLRTRRWILPAAGISSLSVFVVVKSAPWGTYKALRNGTATALLLTCFLFPREIITAIDERLPFSTRNVKGNGEE